MSEKRSFPPKPPLQEKLSTTSMSSNKINKPDVVDDMGKGVGVVKGGRERVKPAEAIVRCEMCRRLQKIVFRVGTPPEWHKCIKCGELQPMDGYHVLAYGLGLPRVLSDDEIAARKLSMEDTRR